MATNFPKTVAAVAASLLKFFGDRAIHQIHIEYMSKTNSSSNDYFLIEKLDEIWFSKKVNVCQTVLLHTASPSK